MSKEKVIFKKQDGYRFLRDAKEWGFKRFVKRPIHIYAKQIDKPFIVETLEGTHKGKAGDYLIIGIKGELYPCDKDIFEESYEIVEY